MLQHFYGVTCSSRGEVTFVCQHECIILPPGGQGGHARILYHKVEYYIASLKKKKTILGSRVTFCATFCVM